ncbi:HIT family protein [Lewinella sp. LCG006]|uniref:HIT family protein n=1 Tax=Lewinella sp. LCG006 TaxID=3231911 RepID=UPI0034616466
MNACIFCKIVAGQLPAHRVYEDEDVLAFMDINPINHGHVLIIPKVHYAELRSIPLATSTAVWEVVKKVEQAIWQTPGLSCEGTNILQNNGAAAGQDVFHAHFHVIPRLSGDGSRFRFKLVHSTDETRKEWAESIKNQMDAK